MGSRPTCRVADRTTLCAGMGWPGQRWTVASCYSRQKSMKAECRQATRTARPPQNVDSCSLASRPALSYGEKMRTSLDWRKAQQAVDCVRRRHHRAQRAQLAAQLVRPDHLRVQAANLLRYALPGNAPVSGACLEWLLACRARSANLALRPLCHAPPPAPSASWLAVRPAMPCRTLQGYAQCRHQPVLMLCLKK